MPLAVLPLYSELPKREDKKIPAGDVRYPGIASREAMQVLKNDYYYGKRLRWLLPAKFYISLRPQYAKMAGNKESGHFRNAGSRAGFFYYYGFDNGFDLTLQYEGNVNKENKGKYWSAYYDIAGLTDYFMAYGAQASGAYNNSGDGSASGMGRTDRMLQVHFAFGDFESTLRYQFVYVSPEGVDGKFSYRLGGSLYYEGWKESGWHAGAAFAYAKYEEISASMRQLGITGDDQPISWVFHSKKTASLSTGTFPMPKTI